jgi:hypothetical protein
MTVLAYELDKLDRIGSSGWKAERSPEHLLIGTILLNNGAESRYS